MSSIWAESLLRSLEEALEHLASALRDCPDNQWETSLWQVAAPGPEHQFLRPDWSPITDPGERAGLVQRWVERRATPWSLGWHALEVFDYDLNGEFGPWAPPPPFAGHPHWRDLPTLPAAWSRAELLGCIEHCRERARHTLAGINEDTASAPLPRSHRYGGRPYAQVLVGILAHTVEHAAQIRQFISGSVATSAS